MKDIYNNLMRVLKVKVVNWCVSDFKESQLRCTVLFFRSILFNVIVYVFFFGWKVCYFGDLD